ncbi:MAG: tetratricopeptide repeat protein [Bacteroidota bacterium]|nr:tetratricopeptide repeat protein [Bacteroidota bacterium]
MKRNLLVGLVLALSFAYTSKTNAQEDIPKYGTDSVTCVRNLSLYKEFERQKNYVDAIKPWRYVFNNCPKATKNIYLDGVKIIGYYIKKASDQEVADKYLDTLLMVYEQRIKYYGKKGFVEGRMGVDILRYKKQDVAKAYNYLHNSVSSQGKSTEDAVSVTFMQSATFLYKTGELSKEKVLDDFTIVLAAVEGRIAYYQAKGNTKKVKKSTKAKNSVEAFFMECGAADCEVLIPFFEPKFNKAPGDLELLKKITRFLDKADCTDSELFLLSAKQLYKLEPSAESAYFIAKLELKNEKFEESAKFYLEAIKLQTDEVEKARYYYELGVITYSQLGEHSKARQYAYKSIELDKTSGKPYILIGNIYAASVKKCGENSFERSAIYWVVVDKFTKAKSVNAELVVDANKLIATYSKHFPNSEESFMNGYGTEGMEYIVGCWINEKTKVRFK